MFIKKTKGIISVFLDNLGLVRSPYSRNDRKGMLYRAWGYIFINLIEGAYYEFGVYQGESFLNSWQAYQYYYKRWSESLISTELWRREATREFIKYEHYFYGFDTFRGTPENNEDNRVFPKGSYSASYAEVEKKCRKANMRFRLFKGLFSEVDEEELKSLQPAAIIHIDSDLFFSARDALEKIETELRQGTILLMDDYNCFSSSDSKGERRALKEFCEKYPQFRFEPWQAYFLVGQSFICHIKENGEMGTFPKVPG